MIRQSVQLADSGTKIKIYCWTEFKDIEGCLFVTVTFKASEKLTDEIKLSMFSEITDKEKRSSSNKSQLSLYISKQVCQKLNGDLKLEKNKKGMQFFIFYIRCLNARKIFGEDKFHSTSTNNSGEIQTGNDIAYLSKIMLMTENIIDQIAFRYIIKELKLTD